ncbi:hypothetical protein [Streptomyces sp. NPDC096934]|uniref:hypothetical protein n=1 Tax=Streptomyces sp. NPDC096934 TaxID=3155551 RepID=UPI003325F04E
MTAQDELRLLPWTGPEGKLCYLSTDDRDGFMSRLADNTESIQLGSVAELLDQVESLTEEQATPENLRLLAKDMAGALRDVLRIATSRGQLREVNAHRF